MKRGFSFALVVLLALPLVGDVPDVQPPSLFAQSAAALLARDFPDPALSYLLLDARSGRTLASRWDHPDQPIPLGSLVKPFTAMAYGAAHGFRFPEHECLGGRTCWQPAGHGRLDLTHAVAYSCNSYFRALAADANLAQSAEYRHFGLQPPPAATPDQLIGLDDSWRLAPSQIARAYLALAARPWDPGIPLILEGMADSARFGTGKAVGRALSDTSALVKTGTAVCTHGNAPGDGFVLALVPADAPRLLLLIRLHGEPGSRTAVTAGRTLRRLQDQTGIPHD
jgi:hypothetical protein